jgi:hypothetical protein
MGTRPVSATVIGGAPVRETILSGFGAAIDEK